MRIPRSFLLYFISLLLLGLIIFVQLGLFMYVGLFSENFYKNRLHDGEYYSLLSRDINFGFRNLSMITGVPVEIFQDTVTDDRIVEFSESHLRQFTRYMLYKQDTVESPVDIKTFKPPLDDFVEEYAAEHNIEIDEELQEQIEGVALEAAAILGNHVMLFNIGEVERFSEFQRFRNNIYFFYNRLPLAILGISICLAILYMLNNKRSGPVLLWLGSSMVAASLFSLIPAALALSYRIPYRFNIGTAYLKEALKSFSLGYIHYFLFTGAILFFAGILALSLYRNYVNSK